MTVASYPNHPVVVAAPFPPGHVSDLHARLLAPYVGEALHQPVTVDNWAGAGGTVALERLKGVAPDGYMLMMHGYGGLAVAPHLVKVNYDPIKDFTPIVKLVTAPLVLVVSASLPVNNVDQLIALAGNVSSAVRGGSFGMGTNSHLALILFNRRTGLDISHSAYPGGFATTDDLVGSAFDLMFDFPPVVMPSIEAGHLKPLAVTSKRRSAALPDVPTLEETGIQGVDITGWPGRIIGPKGLTSPIVTKLNAVFAEAQDIPEVRRRLEAQGLDVDSGTSEDFAEFITAEFERWGSFIEEEGITSEPN